MLKCSKNKIHAASPPNINIVDGPVGVDPNLHLWIGERRHVNPIDCYYHHLWTDVPNIKYWIALSRSNRAAVTSVIYIIIFKKLSFLFVCLVLCCYQIQCIAQTINTLGCWLLRQMFSNKNPFCIAMLVCYLWRFLTMSERLNCV